jgi:hypothetical protein
MPRAAQAGQAWPTVPIQRGTGPLPTRPSEVNDLDFLNMSNPERRLIAAVSLVAIAVCLPAFIALVATMPNTDVLTSPVPPPAAPRVVTMPDPVLPLPTAPKAAPAVVASPAPATAAPAANAKSAPAPATAPARASRPPPAQHAPAVAATVDDSGEKKTHGSKRHAKKQPQPLDIEIWPPQQADPMDSRLAAPPARQQAADDDDGPGAELKRPSF